MLKKIWQSLVRWFRKLFGRGSSGATLAQRGSAKDRMVAQAQLPPLDDTDREYLFMQLLEGVAHGWQQPRAIGFFNKIRQRVRKSDWLDWLQRFGDNLLSAPVANYELAERMVQLGQLDCGEIGDLAGEYGARLLDRQAPQFLGDLLPIMEFDELEFDRIDDQIPVEAIEGEGNSQYRQFGAVPTELLIDNSPIPSPPAADRAEADTTAAETREITLEEFSAMLHQDPGLVAELAEQFGIETTDPQAIVNIVVAQMQQQVQQVSGDLTPISSELTPPAVEPEVFPTPAAPPTPATPPEIPPAPPEVPPIPATPPEIPAPPPEVPPIPATPPEIPAPPPEVPPIPSTPPEMPPSTPTIPGISAKHHSTPPPPPPFPKLEYKPEDPWQSSNLETIEQTLPEAANTPDRRGV
ncbi:hypothetical protein [Chamaesiphon sp.]|uniref:hypothetical protein n=1 Tax=Chamaesiphon sp. TaxID=2814140 RepID=UPI00359439C9